MIKQPKTTKESLSHRRCSTNYSPPRRLPLKPRQEVEKKENISLRETGQTLRCFEYEFPSIDEFLILKPIGKGHYSEVFLAVHVRSGFVGSLKVISKQQFHTQRQEMIQQLIAQIKNQLSSRHPNLIQLYCFFADHENIYLFMELANDGQLYDRLLLHSLSQESTSIVMRDVLSGLCFMHGKGILHRDLKPQNIVLIHGTAKICDFGCSTTIQDKKDKRIGGTPLYWAPEILKNHEYGEGADIWSIGIMVYELVYGDNPFQIRTEDDLLKIIFQKFRLCVGSIQIRTFINLILKGQPSKRPSAEQLLKHPFITKYEGMQTCGQLVN